MRAEKVRHIEALRRAFGYGQATPTMAAQFLREKFPDVWEDITAPEPWMLPAFVPETPVPCSLRVHGLQSHQYLEHDNRWHYGDNRCFVRETT